MRRIRKIRKTTKIIIPTERSINEQSRITKGNIRNNSISKKVIQPAQIERRRSSVARKHAPVNYGKVNPIWKGDTVYIVGGGPSLKGFEWNKLRGKKTIVINKAIKFWPEADVMYWTDGRVYNWLKEDIIKFKGKRFTISPRSYPCDVTVLRRGKKLGIEWSMDSIAHGSNSGAAAINLALHLGAKRIILLGYDMGRNNSESHFHDGYPTSVTADNIYKNQFLPSFSVIRDDIKGKGIQVFNACLTSKLNAFKKITIEEALAFR